MPTLVYCVHGMGCGTADGSPAPAESAWPASVRAAVEWIAETLGLPRPRVVLPPYQEAPAGGDDPDALWIVPVSYHRPFDDFRKGAADREQLLETHRDVLRLGDAGIRGLAEEDFAWVNCLDVLLWWADQVEARSHATVRLLEALTNADVLAREAAGTGGRVRRILVSHSLGNAATTYALRRLARDEPAFARRGTFERWFTLANVAPFLLSTGDVYAPPLVPGADDSLVPGFMCNVRHELDPVPWLMPWRVFSPQNAGPWRQRWERAAQFTSFELVATREVLAPPGGEPEIAHVHGFANYLLAEPVALRLAGAMRGRAFGSAELEALGWRDAHDALPRLACRNDPNAMSDLRAAVRAFATFQPIPGVDPEAIAPPWVERMLRAVDLLRAARARC